MSYVERAFYDYLKSTMTSGVRMLLERRLILFSFFLVIIGVVNTILTYLYQNEKDIVTLSTLESVFLLELAVAIGFICAGLLSPIFRLRSTLGRFLMLIFSSAIIFGVSIIGEPQNVDEAFLEWIPIFLLFSWAFFIPLSTFAFAYGLFSNKITGSVLFLGKPSADRRAIFWGPIFLLALGIGIASLAIILVVTFLILAQAQDQIVAVDGIADESNSSQWTAGYNASVTLTNAVNDVPGWVPLIVIASIGGILLGLVTVFRRR